MADGEPSRSASSMESSSLRPSSAASRSYTMNNHLMSPSDIVGPSPVTSVGTEVTEIDDEASDDARLDFTSPISSRSPQVGYMVLHDKVCRGLLTVSFSC